MIDSLGDIYDWNRAHGTKTKFICKKLNRISTTIGSNTRQNCGVHIFGKFGIDYS